jgi:hypothetical protein
MENHEFGTGSEMHIYDDSLMRELIMHGDGFQDGGGFFCHAESSEIIKHALCAL